MAKNSAMKELAIVRQRKLKDAISSQETLVIRLGERIGAELERIWWSLYVRWAEEIEREFNRLFFNVRARSKSPRCL